MRTRMAYPAAAITLCLVGMSGATALASTPPEESTSPPGSAQETESPIASAKSSGENEHIQSANADIIKLDRSESSELAAITVKISNTSNTNLHDNRFQNEVYDYREPLFSGVTLIDQQSRIKYNPMMDKENFCLCSGYVPRSPYSAYVKPDESVSYWAMYSLPSDINSVDVEIPGFDPIKNVPVG